MVAEPKLHHYVPRFYLRYFCDSSDRLWVWDKMSRKVYQSSVNGVAAQTHFYRVPEFIGSEVDPLFLEKGLSLLEGDAAAILDPCVEQLVSAAAFERIEMSDDDRRTLSSFLAVQFLRTAEQRDILSLFAEQSGSYKDVVSDDEKINLHAQMLCSGGLVELIGDRIFESIWVYARNQTGIPFWTSDNPVAFKTGDNQRWLKGPGILSSGSYVVFPLTPEYVLYCKEPKHWSAIQKLDSMLSPVALTDEMVQHENSGQIFMATRHVIASVEEFSWADEFVTSIGTDLYTPKENENDG